MTRRSLSVVVLAYLPNLAAADRLEVRHNACIYSEPSGASVKLVRIVPGEHEGPYLRALFPGQKVNGYCKLRLRGRTVTDWIYKSLVRRYETPHPRYAPYKRLLYGHWIDADGDCHDTRAKVFICDDDHQVSVSRSDNCRVIARTWGGPYTGETFHIARQIDADHVVPFKNAHESGAWAWSRGRRMQYANYREDNHRLMTVSASGNRRNGARGPD